ncbi:GNAT family N-acetyltransferase [Oryzobacter telluris]|uniref:GNAT family N-acetyltransferase n=1 Tax=Oryzobacter telluris TaxID=3149179 RepID=UPI00370DC61A
MVVLARPHARYRRSYLRAHDEFLEAREGHRDGEGAWVEPADAGGYPGAAFSRAELETDEGFARLVRFRLDRSLEDTPRPTGHVPSTVYWIGGDDPAEYLGSLSIRHSLTPFLRDVAGHVGYSVRPGARRRGVATEALRLALPEAAALGLDRVLVTCDTANVASAKVIEANGGVLEDVRGVKRRYWVATT